MVSCLQKFDSNFGDYFRVKTKNQSSMNEKLPLVISQLVKLVPTTKLLQKWLIFFQFCQNTSKIKQTGMSESC